MTSSGMAKRAFVLADQMKSGAFATQDTFQGSLLAMEGWVQSLSESQLDAIIGQDATRLGRYNQAAWTLQKISLGKCTVWPKMDDRSWATGRIPEVAKQFAKFEPPDNRIWRMKDFAAIYAAKLPIIILRNSASEFAIDDGNHRAIAMALAGITKITAWVGLPDSEKRFLPSICGFF
jgi:hypothetical protein